MKKSKQILDRPGNLEESYKNKYQNIVGKIDIYNDNNRTLIIKADNNKYYLVSWSDFRANWEKINN